MITRELLEFKEGGVSLFLDNPNTLEGIEELKETTHLHLRNFQKIDCLKPLKVLPKIQSLRLSTTVGWDGSGKTLNVKSFKPLSGLNFLSEIYIIGVIPDNYRLEPLAKLKNLKEIIIGNTSFYQLEDFAYLSRSLKAAKGLVPITQSNFQTMCARCKLYPELFLNGVKPRARKYVCPRCNKKLILKHLERWTQAGGVP